MQGEEREAAELMRELLHRSVRLGLHEAMASEVEALCGPKNRPDPGTERGVAYLDGGKDEIVSPRVREKNGVEVRLATYEAASSPHGLFSALPGAQAQGFSFGFSHSTKVPGAGVASPLAGEPPD